jgi:glutaredoxin
MAAGNLNPGPRAVPRRWLPPVIGIAALIALQQYLKTPYVEPVRCGYDVVAEMADVVMLSASWCRFCRRARGFFAAHGINYCEYDIERSQRGAELYQRSRLGIIPVIYIGDDIIVGFNRDEIAQTLIAQDLLSLDDY